MSAYFASSVLRGDVRLFSRSTQSAVIVHVTGVSQPEQFRRELANRLAAIALGRLDASQAGQAQ